MPTLDDQADIVCETTKGRIEIILKPEWSPQGVERVRELVGNGFFKNVPLFRCVDRFLCQFGYTYSEPDEQRQAWSTIPDDVPNENTPRRFKRGYVSFAGNGKNSRSNHLFVTLGENVSSLGTQPWETPIGYVSEQSMEVVVSRWTTKYGDMPPWGKGPSPSKILSTNGEAYLKSEFPDLDYLISCSFVESRENDTGNGSKLVGPQLVAFQLDPKLGKVVIELHPEWSPKGVERFLQMIDVKYLDEARFFRVVPGFVVQFGLPADPKRYNEFSTIKDDPVIKSNEPGTISFATSGPNTRTTQLFINLGNNRRLDGMGFSPIGQVVEGFQFIQQINSEYREMPDQGMISKFGNSYLNKNFPRLSYIRTARLISQEAEKLIEPSEGTQFLREADRQPFQQQQDGDSAIGIFVLFMLVLVLAYLFVVRKVYSQSQHKSS